MTGKPYNTKDTHEEVLQPTTLWHRAVTMTGETHSIKEGLPLTDLLLTKWWHSAATIATTGETHYIEEPGSSWKLAGLSPTTISRRSPHCTLSCACGVPCRFLSKH